VNRQRFQERTSLIVFYYIYMHLRCKNVQLIEILQIRQNQAGKISHISLYNYKETYFNYNY